MHSTKVRSTFEDVSSRSVTPPVGTEIRGALDSSRGTVHDLAHRAGVKSPAAHPDKNSRPASLAGQRRTPLLQPGTQGRRGWHSKGDHPLPIPLAHHPQGAADHVDVTDVETGQLPHPDARGVQDFKNRDIPKPQGRLSSIRSSIQHRSGLLRREHRGQVT